MDDLRRSIEHLSTFVLLGILGVALDLTWVQATWIAIAIGAVACDYYRRGKADARG